MKATFFAVVGGKKSGKTTIIEILVRELAKKGYKICVVKHIPEVDFTIDKSGKDTWKFAKAGARIVVSAAADEIATIEKTSLKGQDLEKLLKRCGDSDIVFVEGFRRLVGKDVGIHKLVVVRSSEEAKEAKEAFEPILAFVGLSSTHAGVPDTSIINISKSPRRILDLVEKVVRQTMAK